MSPSASRVLFALLAGSLLPTVGLAQEAVQADAPPRMGEVVVIATRSEESLLDVSPTVTVAGPEELHRRMGATTLQMLRDEPGVWAQRVGAAGGAPILRGRVGKNVLHLLDGVRLNSGTLVLIIQPILNQVQPWAIDRIEVLRGPASVQYGGDALGGVISVQTRRVDPYPDEGVLYGGRVGTRYGSVDDLLQSDAYAWASGNGFSLLAGGGFQDVKDYEGGGGFGEVGNTNYETDGFYVKLGWKPAEHHLLELAFQRFDRDDIHNYIQSGTNASGIATLLDPNQQRDMAKMTYEGRDLEGWISSANAYLYAQQFDALSFRTTETATRFNRRATTEDESIYGLGFQGVSPIRLGREHELVWGADYRYEKLANSVRIRRTTKATGAVTEFEPQGTTPDGLYEVWDGFAQLKVSLREDLTVTTGLRYEVTHLDTDPAALDPIPPVTLDSIDLDEWWQSVTYSVGCNWWFTDEWGLAGSVATGFRAPNYSDTVRFGLPVRSTGRVFLPSSDVEPEEAIQYELGVRHAGENVTASLAAYYVDLTDEIVAVPAGIVDVPGVGPRAAVRNSTSGRGVIQGVDLTLEWRPGGGLTLFGGASYAFGVDRVADAPRRFIPPLNGKVGVRYERLGPHRWWVEAGVRLVDRLTRHSPEDEIDAGFASDPALGSPNTTTNPPLRSDFDLPGYAVVGLRGGVEVFRRDRVSGNFTVSVENILDKRYREIFSRQVVEPGIGVVTSFEVEF